ncbi:hypothetical protein [Neobacillus sp. LXY-1]|uniref:hypothetical protein n=1 Tax=Neobacillus sp. LXY-1 TaxID=3379133 RepID=UPI003EE3CF11
MKEKTIQRHMNIPHPSIQALNQKLADLMIISESDSITEFESLILDRSATALAQNILRALYVEERRKTEEEQIYRHLPDLESALKSNGCVVLLSKTDQLDEKDSDITHLKIFFCSIFQSQGFFLLSTIRKNQLISILLNKRKSEDWKSRIEAGIHQAIEFAVTAYDYFNYF